MHSLEITLEIYSEIDHPKRSFSNIDLTLPQVWMIGWCFRNKCGKGKIWYTLVTSGYNRL